MTGTNSSESYLKRIGDGESPTDTPDEYHPAAADWNIQQCSRLWRIPCVTGFWEDIIYYINSGGTAQTKAMRPVGMLGFIFLKKYIKQVKSA